LNLDAPAAFDGGSSFMDDGSWESTMDQVNNAPQVDLPPADDEFGFGVQEDELGADMGPSQQPADKMKESAAAMTNI
jgi:hypothetical protein